MSAAAATPGSTVAIGVDVGGTKCLGVAVDGENVLAEARVATPRTGPGQVVLDAVAGVVDELVGATGMSPASVGVGVPGLVDREGVLRFAPNLPGGTGLEVQATLEKRLGVPVFTDNDATCAAWGEARSGAARGLTDVVMVTLGTGIGGGIIAGGRLNRGANGFAGEFGHMVVDPHGPPCPCGQTGCWERFASGGGLGRLGREAAQGGRAARVVDLAGGDPEAVRGEHVTAAAAEGDGQARDIMVTFAGWLALGLVNLANVFDPQALVIGGGLVEAGTVLFDPARAAFAGLLAGRDHRHPVEVLAATLGEHAGALGAAYLPESRF